MKNIWTKANIKKMNTSELQEWFNRFSDHLAQAEFHKIKLPKAEKNFKLISEELAIRLG